MPVPAVLSAKTHAAVNAVAQARAEMRTHDEESAALNAAVAEDVADDKMNVDEAKDLLAAYGVAYAPPADAPKSKAKPQAELELEPEPEPEPEHHKGKGKAKAD
jgi:hypothetical protein